MALPDAAARRSVLASRVALQRDVGDLATLVTSNGVNEWVLSPIEVRSAGEGRGLGVFAARDLLAGERLVAESPLVHWPNPRATQNSYMALEAIVSRLDATRTQQFWAFGQSSDVHGDAKTVKGTWLTNALAIVYNGQPAEQAQTADGPGEAAMFLRVSRFNHHCAPSCHYEWNNALRQMTVHVLRNVRAGEELTLSYLAPSGRVKTERQGMLLKDFGFLCDCSKCSLTGAALAQSNGNQKAIGDLRHDKLPDGTDQCSSRFGAAPDALLALLHKEGLPEIWARTAYYSAMMTDDARSAYWAGRLADCLRTAMGSDHPSVEQYAMARTLGPR